MVVQAHVLTSLAPCGGFLRDPHRLRQLFAADFGSINKKPQNQTKNNKFIFCWWVGCLFVACGLFRFFVEWRRIEMEVDMEGVWLQMRRTGETRFKPTKQLKKRSEVEPGVAGDHPPTLKSKLGYLRLESLQALGNGGFEVEETLVFGGVCINFLDKN